MDSIDRSLLNVSQLFRSILDLYTLDNGRVQPSFETFALEGFCVSCCARTARLRAGPGWRCAWCPAATGPAPTPAC